MTDDTLEVKLAKAEALKRFRSAVRLELAIAGDRIIGTKVPEIKEKMDSLLHAGGVPALQKAVNPWAKELADAFMGIIEDNYPELPALPESNAKK